MSSCIHTGVGNTQHVDIVSAETVEDEVFFNRERPVSFLDIGSGFAEVRVFQELVQTLLN
nr:hypothetical protein [Gammaproteobacteria bacterium]